MNIPEDLRYTKNDDWVRVDGNAAVAGITDYAQDQLSDIVYLDLPAAGQTFQQGSRYGTVESVKAASDLYLPIGGTITAANETLGTAPEIVNTEPYGAGWIIKFTIANAAELEGLMDAAAYRSYCEERQK